MEHPHNYSLVHPLTHSLTYSRTHSFTHWSNQWMSRSVIQSVFHLIIIYGLKAVLFLFVFLPSVFLSLSLHSPRHSFLTYHFHPYCLAKGQHKRTSAFTHAFKAKLSHSVRPLSLSTLVYIPVTIATGVATRPQDNLAAACHIVYMTLRRDCKW